MLPPTGKARSAVPTAGLVTLAVASSVVWTLAFAQRMPLSVHHGTPHLDLPSLLGTNEAGLNTLLLVAGAQILIYVMAIWSARFLRDPRLALFAILLAFFPAVPLILTYPAGAGDVYAYIAEADLVLRYGVNPFAVPVAAIPDHPLLPFLDYPNETTHYGPLWLLIAVALRFVSGQDLLATLIVFKLAATVLLLLTAWVCYLAWKDREPASAPLAAVIVGWNPLLLFELAGNAHNDIAMMLFSALALFLQGRGRRRGAIAALVAACLIKYVAVILLPLFLLANYRQAGPWPRWLPGALLDILGLSLVMGSLLLVVGVEGTIGILQTMTQWYTTSVGAAAYQWLSQSIPRDRAGELVGVAVKVTFLGLYLIGALWLWLRPSWLRACCFWVMLAFMAVETVWFQPWYVTWALPLAALAGGPAALGASIGMTVGGFGVHAVMGFIWRLNWHQGDPVLIHALGATAVWAPVIVGLLAGLRIRALGRDSTPSSCLEGTRPSVSRVDSN